MPPAAQAYNGFIGVIQDAVWNARSAYRQTRLPDNPSVCRQMNGVGDVLGQASQAVRLWKELVPAFDNDNIAASTGVDIRFIAPIEANDEVEVAAIAVFKELTAILAKLDDGIEQIAWMHTPSDAEAAGFDFGDLHERVPALERNLIFAAELDRWNRRRRGMIDASMNRAAELLTMAGCEGDLDLEFPLAQDEGLLLLVQHAHARMAYYALRDDCGMSHADAMGRVDANVRSALVCTDDCNQVFVLADWAKASNLHALMQQQHGDKMGFASFELLAGGSPLPPTEALIAAEAPALQVVWK